MYITVDQSIDIDLDDIVNDDDHREEIIKALSRNDHHFYDTAEILDEIKKARTLLTSLIRKLES